MGNYCCCCCCCLSSEDGHRSPSNIKPPSPSPGTTLRLYQNKGKEVVSDPTITTPRPSPTITMKIPYLKIFTFAELKSATRDFRPDTVLGEGGFGTVFKGWIDQKTYAPSRVGFGIPVAVKKANSDTCEGLKQWQAEVNFLGKFTHPNLVKLLGFCWEEREFLLVYEYMQKGSLETHLFKRGTAEPLSWEVRLNIAIGAASGLAFLHNSEKKVIYRDFKTSNILLDGNYNAKLSDFGLARLGPPDGNSHLTTDVLGTYGYAAPEYLATGHLYVKSDVYSFGVVLLEMLTGMRALDLNRPTGQHILVEWARPSLDAKRKLKKIMDPKIQGNYPLQGAYQAAQLILTCLESVPKNRPSMEQVLESLGKVNDIKFKPKQTKNNPIPPNQQQKSPLHHPYKQNHRRSPIHANHVNKRAAQGQADQQPSTSRPSPL